MRRRPWLYGLALPWLVASTQNAGQIDLFLFDEPHTRAALYERVGDSRVPVGDGVVEPPGTAFQVEGAAQWRCDRPLRRFEADAVRADGSTRRVAYSVRTPSCGDRMNVTVRRSGPVRLVAVRDRWQLGDVAPRVCVPRWGCRKLDFAGDNTAGVAVPARGRVTVRLGAHRWTARRLPPLLVTGDSTVQNVDSLLADRLAGKARVIRDWRGGTSVSYDKWRWPEIAAEQARRHRPRVTVLSIGANEGWQMRLPTGATAGCCTPEWRAEYTRRAELIMRAFVRDGRGRVLWMLLPMPRDERRQDIARAVNESVRAAADGEAGVTVLATDEAITPGGRFRLRAEPGGPRIRQRDGVHLTPAGAEIAGELVFPALPARFRP